MLVYPKKALEAGHDLFGEKKEESSLGRLMHIRKAVEY
jgi:hypothetical protein